MTVKPQHSVTQAGVVDHWIRYAVPKKGTMLSTNILRGYKVHIVTPSTGGGRHGGIVMVKVID